MATVTTVGKTRVITEFPHETREIEHIFIPLKDGTRLAARIWLPVNAEAEPVPAILEYLPYRKRDGTAARDELSHPYLAGHGYACVRVDIRGYGESDGLMMEEYDRQEHLDALEVIDWITSQSWCSGNVGMWGISWGGFNSLQVASYAPEALKAIMTLCSTDDRYRDDIHYHGGCLLSENVGWAGVMLSYSAYAPDKLLVGESWRKSLMERLENMPLHAKTWLEHSTRDDYWKYGSVCENYGDIKAAVYSVGGWWDSYHPCIFRLMSNLPGPKKALVGPWAHKYPHFAIPDPAIGFLQEALRWWDYWLKGIDNGIMDEEALTIYLQDAMKPQASYPERPGYWLREKSWPSVNVSSQRLYLGNDTLHGEPTDGHSVVDSPENVGTSAGEFCIIWLGPEFPTDQRRDDAFSTVYTSQPLTEDWHILGAPVFEFDIECDKPVGKLAVRLNDVFPNGETSRITYGVLNLCMRDSMDHPEFMEPARKYRVKIQLDDIGYTVPAGHKLRLSVSDSYWPIIWPSPEKTSMKIHLSESYVDIPLYNGSSRLPDNPYQPPESATPLNMEMLREGDSTRETIEDAVTGRQRTRIFDDFGTMLYKDHGLEVDQTSEEVYSILPDDPTSACMEVTWKHKVRRGDWNYSVYSYQKLTCDQSQFFLEVEQIAWEGETEIHRKFWSETIDRQFQ